MRIKKYEAETIAKAMSQVKRDFGSKAVILHSKNITKGGILGLFGKDFVEVVAGVDINIMDAGTPKPKPAPPKPAPSKPEKSPPDRLTPQLNQLKTDVATLSDRLEGWMAKNAHKPTYYGYQWPHLDQVHAGLVRCGLSQQSIEPLFQSLFDSFTGKQLRDQSQVKRHLQQAVKSRLKVGGDLATSVTPYVAFVGPTGVGKTTMIAKLAADCIINRQQSVGLISVDTYRIAAIEQLKTFAQIMSIDLEVVYTKRELGQAMDRLKSKDLVLIDTAGRSPHHSAHIGELHDLLSLGKPLIRPYLVLGLSAKLEDALTTVHRFGPMGIKHLILTKQDETTTMGNVVDILGATQASLAYLSTGQNVPDDFEKADRNRLTQQILNNMKGFW